MEEITRAAKAIYEKLPPSEKKEMLTMFESMDQDGDKKISLQEFKTYLASKGEQAKANSNLFILIDRNGDQTLAFEEALTLLYISESGRPVCDGCGKFIQALFFTCTDCHYNRPAEGGYNVCVACYEAGNFRHDHTEFLDNYTLFAEMKKKNGAAGSATIRTNGSLLSDRTLLTTGTNQQGTGRREMFKKGLRALKDFFSGSAGAELATTVSDTVGGNETQE